jgi:hypothetical protein
MRRGETRATPGTRLGKLRLHRGDGSRQCGGVQERNTAKPSPAPSAPVDCGATIWQSIAICSQVLLSGAIVQTLQGTSTDVGLRQLQCLKSWKTRMIPLLRARGTLLSKSRLGPCQTYE